MLDRRLRLVQVVLALVGLASAGYLTYTKYAHHGVCGVSGGCTTVQQSPWSELFGIPVSLLGVLGYLGVLVALSLRGELPRLALVVMTGVGFLFSLFLMYRAYVTLEAFCPFCTTSAVVMTLLFVISTVRYLRGPDPLAAAPGAAEPLAR
ncbi:vitamin K epoxide reductase family protein [Patulibacter sp. S7RM1-6]